VAFGERSVARIDLLLLRRCRVRLCKTRSCLRQLCFELFGIEPRERLSFPDVIVEVDIEIFDPAGDLRADIDLVARGERARRTDDDRKGTADDRLRDEPWTGTAREKKQRRNQNGRSCNDCSPPDAATTPVARARQPKAPDQIGIGRDIRALHRIVHGKSSQTWMLSLHWRESRQVPERSLPFGRERPRRSAVTKNPLSSA